jgi:hypothetical protein
METGQRVAAGHIIRVCVDLQRGADPGVAQDGLSVTCWHTEILEQRPDRMPQMMHLDHPDTAAVADTG